MFFPKYQRFTEDQRLLENMGLVEKSSVTAYLEEYYEKHPLDNSFEGILARKTGLTKENVIAVLDAIEHIEFLASYEPNGYAPYHYIIEDDSIVLVIKNDTLNINKDILGKRSINTDKKLIRNFAC